MITRALIKAKVDKVQEEYLEALYRIVRAFESPAQVEAGDTVDDVHWQKFIAETYGCFADDPIARGDQGRYEIRETIE